MSHVRRNRPQHARAGSGRIARKKNNRRAWISFGLMLILFVSVLAGILFAIISGGG